MKTNQGHADPNNSGRDKYERHVDGDITVRGQLEVHAPPDLIQREETERAKDRTHKKREFLVSLITLGFVILYAGLTAWQGCSTRSVVTEAQNANKIAIAANRPWIGQIEGDLSDLDFIPRKDKGTMDVQYIWRFRNSGHRPARLTLINETETWVNQCSMTPDFIEPKDASVPEGSETGSKTGGKGVVLPDGKFQSNFRESIPIEKWQEIVRGTLHYCIYIKLEYRDIDFPNEIHHTRDCEVLMPSVMTYSGCAIEYAYAD
jgi:hypothetical protein